MEFNFILTSLITYGLGAIAFTPFLFRFNTKNSVSNVELFLYGLGLGPAITSLILYFALMAMPGMSEAVYVALVLGVYVICIGLNFKHVKTWFKTAGQILRYAGKSLAEPFGKEGDHGLLEDLRHFFFSDRFFFLFAIVLTLFGLGLTINRPITDHDALIYAAQGKVFYNDLAISYGAQRFNEANAYLYIGLHAFSFPLQLTWERIMQGVVGGGGDLYFRSINYHYMLLMLAVPYYWLRKIDVRLGLLAVLIIWMTQVNLDKVMHHSLDTYRVFMFAVMIVFMLRFIKKSNLISIIGFGVFGGLTGFAHSFGVILLPVAVLAAFIFMQGHLLKVRIPKLMGVGALVLAFGCIHYIIDILWGTGWIFQDVKFF